MTPGNVGTKASAINISETCLTDISLFWRFIWKPIDPVVPPSCTVSPSSIAGSTLRVERRCKSSWCNMKKGPMWSKMWNWHRILPEAAESWFFFYKISKALVVPVLWFSTWCFCQQILKQFLIRTENFICFSHSHCLLIVEGNLQQLHDLLALAINIFSRVSSSRYFSSIPNSSIRFTRNKSWKMTKGLCPTNYHDVR